MGLGLIWFYTSKGFLSWISLKVTYMLQAHLRTMDRERIDYGGHPLKLGNKPDN